MRSARKPKCIIPGCTAVGAVICRPHWLSLPLPLRERWWEETDYSKKKPNAELLRVVREAVAK